MNCSIFDCVSAPLDKPDPSTDTHAARFLLELAEDSDDDGESLLDRSVLVLVQLLRSCCVRCHATL